jgi:Na+-driven multidrug efflux pump
MSFLGSSVAVSIRVGNLLGAGQVCHRLRCFSAEPSVRCCCAFQADRAKLAARVGIMFGFCFALVWAAVLFGTRNSFADWFTSDDDVRSLVAKIACTLQAGVAVAIPHVAIVVCAADLIATYQILDSTVCTLRSSFLLLTCVCENGLIPG